MDVTIKFLIVAGLGVIELWMAIPAGIAMKLSPVLYGTASAMGAIVAAVIVVLSGERLRSWLLKGRKKGWGNQSKAGQIWEKYGIIGLGILSPLISGAPIGAAIGISLGAPPRKLLFWMIIGIIAWAIILTLVATFGLFVLSS